MQYRTTSLMLMCVAVLSMGCGNNNGPTTPTTTTTTAPPSPLFQIDVLMTVYRTETSGALWSRGTFTDERIAQILLGVEDLNTVTGNTNLNNEGGRVEMQAAINRVRTDFQAPDYEAAFGDTQQNLERFLNDADQDNWSIDGRNGRGKDWPHDSNGNDPDGWTGQIIVTVIKLN